MDPLISIGMPVYNCQATVAAAIRSILAQSYGSWELLLVDDGSTDDTVAVAAQFQDPRIQILADGERRRLPARLNQTVGLARGQYYARMDGDDVAYPQRLARQFEYMRAHPALDLIGAWLLVFGRHGVPLGKRVGTLTQPWRYKTLLQSIPLPHPTFFGLTQWFREHPYPEQVPESPDQLLLLASLGASRFGIVPEILLGYREESLSIAKQARYRRALILSSASLRRHLGTFVWLGAVGLQVCKLGVDCVAVGTGLNYRVLRMRCQRLEDAEAAAWQAVWREVAG